MAETLVATAPAAVPAALAAKPAHGVWSPALTPLDADLAPDHRRFADHLRWLKGQGLHGVALLGSTGEANCFSVDERKALLDTALGTGIPSDALMVGTGCCALTDSVDLTRHAAESGCTNVLVLPPFYYKGIPEDGLFRSFAEVIDRVGRDDIRVYVYHFPRLTGVDITPALVARLAAAYPGIVAGVKDSSGDFDGTLAFIEACPDLAIFPGSETYLLAGLRAGGVGCITATANVNAAAIRNVFDLWAAEDAGVDAAQDAITATRKAIEGNPLPPALKHILAHHRGDAAWRTVRPPFTELSAAAGDKLLADLQALGYRLTD
jgi:4-hydroxy-tetrahydrodipicolinate synthase